jgi:hypothetical protein
MKIYITQTDINETIRLAIVNVARKLNINDIDWKISNELYHEIKLSGHSLFLLLDNYLLNYMAWVTFIQEHRDREGYTAEESQKLNKLTINRNTTRTDLINAINA